jgi:exodeoxyribonuclease V beta subunit
VDQAMAEHGYHLQHLLYTLALHRYLARRVRGYAFDSHFGGVLYLFVRGVRPDWRDADGRPSGVYAHRPAADTLAALEALFAHRPGVIA